MLQRVNVEVIDGAGERKMGRGELGSAAPGPLTVEGGTVLTPEMLQRLLPDVAMVVKGAIQSAGATTQLPPLSNPQLPSKINQDQASEQKPLQINKLKQEKVKQPNLESRQRWNMFPCNLCTLRFPSRATLNEHRLNHEPFNFRRTSEKTRDKSKEQPYMCKYCPRIFATKERRQLHMASHLKSKTVRETNGIDNKQNHSDIFYCNICDKYFANKLKLHVHKKRTACYLMDIISPRKYSCHICSEEFEDTFGLTLHMRTHGSPHKSYSARKPKPSSVDASKPHKDTELNDSFSVQEPKPAESVNATKVHKNGEFGESFSVRNPKITISVNATNAHKDTEMASSYLARDPNPTDVVNVTKVHKETASQSSKLAGIVNATKAHKDRELSDSYSDANPKPADSVNAPKVHKDSKTINSVWDPMHRNIEWERGYSIKNPKPADSIDATITYKRQLEDSVRTCNRIEKTYTRFKIPKLINGASFPTANNQTMAKKVPGENDFRDSLNERINPIVCHISDVQSQEKPDPTSESSKAEIMFAVLNSITAKEEFREKCDKSVNPEASSDSHKIIERIFLKPELLERTEIDLTGEVSAMNNNIEYVMPNAVVVNKEFANDIYYHDGINSEVKKQNTTVVKAEEPEVVIGEKISEYANDVGSSVVIKKEPQELELDKETIMKTDLLSLCKHDLKDVVKKELSKDGGDYYCISPKVNKQDIVAVIAAEPERFGEIVSENCNESTASVKEEPEELEFGEESMMKAELLSLCKHEVKDELMLGSLLQKPQVTCELEKDKNVDYIVNEKNIDTVIVKEEFTENLSEEPKDGVNAALEAAWKELYAEHEAMELALVKIQKDPEITDTVDLTPHIKNEQYTASVKEELEVIKYLEVTGVVDLTAQINNMPDTVSMKEEPKKPDVVDFTAQVQNQKDTVSVKEELKVIEDPERPCV